MKTNVADTSIQQYHILQNSGSLSSQQSRVLAVMCDGGQYTRSELAQACRLPINCVAGRVHELLKKKVIEEGAPRRCKVTGHAAKVVQFTPIWAELKPQNPDA